MQKSALGWTAYAALRLPVLEALYFSRTSMRTAIIVFTFTMLLYILGFFLSVPIALSTTNTKVSWLIQFSHKVPNQLYGWVSDLNSESKIRRIWIENAECWCSKFESCEFSGHGTPIENEPNESKI